MSILVKTPQEYREFEVPLEGIWTHLHRIIEEETGLVSFHLINQAGFLDPEDPIEPNMTPIMIPKCPDSKCIAHYGRELNHGTSWKLLETSHKECLETLSLCGLFDTVDLIKKSEHVFIRLHNMELARLVMEHSPHPIDWTLLEDNNLNPVQKFELNLLRIALLPDAPRSFPTILYIIPEGQVERVIREILPKAKKPEIFFRVIDPEMFRLNGPLEWELFQVACEIDPFSVIYITEDALHRNYSRFEEVVFRFLDKNPDYPPISIPIFLHLTRQRSEDVLFAFWSRNLEAFADWTNQRTGNRSNFVRDEQYQTLIIESIKLGLNPTIRVELIPRLDVLSRYLEFRPEMEKKLDFNVQYRNNLNFLDDSNFMDLFRSRS